MFGVKVHDFLASAVVLEEEHHSFHQMVLQVFPLPTPELHMPHLHGLFPCLFLLDVSFGHDLLQVGGGFFEAGLDDDGDSL